MVSYGIDQDFPVPLRCDQLRILHLRVQAPCVCVIFRKFESPACAVSNIWRICANRHGQARRHENWMIYSLPPPQPELALQLSCLQDCVQTEVVFQGERKSLESPGAKVQLIPKALGTSCGTRLRAKAAAAPSAKK